MSEETELRSVSVAGKAGAGLLIGGGPGGFTGPFPQEATTFLGGEVVLDFTKGKLALVYYWGHAEDRFSQDDLPISDELKTLLQFSSTRNANSHFGLAEWRWSEEPLFQSGRWTFIRPEVGLGMGVFDISTAVDDGEKKQVGMFNFIMTGSIAINLIELGDSGISTGVRIFAGTSFGMMAEAGLRWGF